MTIVIILSVMLAVCFGLTFVAPHRVKRPESFKPRTLGGIYGELFRDMPSRIDERLAFFGLIIATAMTASFYPALRVAMLGVIRPASLTNGGAWSVDGGVITMVGAAANLLIMGISDANFAFGGGSSTLDMTPFVCIIPTVQSLAAIVSVLIGCSSTFARRAFEAAS